MAVTFCIIKTQASSQNFSVSSFGLFRNRVPNTVGRRFVTFRWRAGRSQSQAMLTSGAFVLPCLCSWANSGSPVISRHRQNRGLFRHNVWRTTTLKSHNRVHGSKKVDRMYLGNGPTAVPDRWRKTDRKYTALPIGRCYGVMLQGTRRRLIPACVAGVGQYNVSSRSR